MSWSGNIKFDRAPDIMDDFEAINRLAVSGNEQALQERDVQVAAAKHAAIELIQNSAFDFAKTFSVSMSGHANPAHKAFPGYANETITVTVTVYEYVQTAGLAQDPR